MPESFVHLCSHIIFSTKGRRGLITADIEKRLYPYIAGLINNHGGKPIIINGTEDHIHILTLCPKATSLSEFVKTIKSSSSKWIYDAFRIPFQWQTGYASFSVSKSRITSVRDYITGQKEHHRKEKYSDEIRTLLQVHDITMDETI